MKALFVIAISISIPVHAQQNIRKQLQHAVETFLKSPKGKVSNLSYCVTDEKGNTIYEYQSEKGLTTASTQKIFTAATALELLSPEYRYTTPVFTLGEITKNTLYGDLVIQGSGDPTLGSWRYTNTQPEKFLSYISQKLKEKGINNIKGNIYIKDDIFDIQTIPGGWAWQDIGNYYGAGVFGINWRENQFDLLTDGNKILGTNYPLDYISWVNELTTGGNSDQSIIYTAPFSNVAYINGQLPKNKKMTVSGALPNPPLQLGIELKKHLLSQGINISGDVATASIDKFSNTKREFPNKKEILLEWKSPTVDEMVFWFLNKSVNLYGEGLLKTIAKEKTGNSQYTQGIKTMKNHWIKNGIAEEMINFADGSGLSPKNYVSTKAMVLALLYAKKQSWFSGYFLGFPTQKNGMKMKSGTMRHTKSFAGIHTSTSQKTYYFAITINNYQSQDLSTPLFLMLEPLK